MTMTPEQIRNHVNEVWEDDEGDTFLLIAVGSEKVFIINHGAGCQEVMSEKDAVIERLKDAVKAATELSDWFMEHSRQAGKE